MYVNPVLNQPTASSVRFTYSYLQLWIFAGDLSFSSSIRWSARHDPTRAMKIFWKPAPPSPPSSSSSPSEPDDDDDDHDDNANATDAPTSRAAPAAAPLLSSPERIALAAPLFASLHAALRDSSELLPAAARSLGGWSVGLLERFALADVGRGAEVPAPEPRVGSPMRVATNAEIPIRVVPYSQALLE